MIQTDCCFGEYRHGPHLLSWARSFTNHLGVSEQSALIDAVQSTKISHTASYEQFGHTVTTLLLNWLKISGNDVSKPAGFYHRLLHAFPADIDTGKINQLRTWVADKIADEHALLNSPHTFIATLIKRALIVGLAQTPAKGDAIQVINEPNKTKPSNPNLTASGRKIVRDKFCCSARICFNTEKSTDKCICFNRSVKPFADASKGELTFVKWAQDYVDRHPECKSTGITKVSFAHIKAVGKQAEQDKSRTNTVSVISDVTDSDAFNNWMRSLEVDSVQVVTETSETDDSSLNWGGASAQSHFPVSAVSSPRRNSMVTTSERPRVVVHCPWGGRHLLQRSGRGGNRRSSALGRLDDDFSQSDWRVGTGGTSFTGSEGQPSLKP